jgi:outer membrane PBP1 activator LpoA protein
MKGRNIKRLALLLPFSSKSERLRTEAASMLKAAELAVFGRDEADILLIALDTGGTEQGSASATKAAVTSGADVILGPVLARSVQAASREAQSTNTPVIAFSTDQSVAGNGTYLLSFPPEAEVKRIVEYAATTGAKNFAFLGPQSAYGQRVRAEYGRNVTAVGGQITASESYKGNDIGVMQAPAQKMAKYYKDHERRTLGQGRRAFEAIMLPEGGTPLRSLAPLLPYSTW